MQTVGQETCPLPDDPSLAAMAVALNDARQWAEIVDRQWRLVYMTDDARLSYGGLLERASVPLGAHYFGPESVDTRLGWRGGMFPLEIQRGVFGEMGGLVLPDTPGGRDELRELVDPRHRDIVDGLSPIDPQRACSFGLYGTYKAGGRPVEIPMTAIPVWDAEGKRSGTALISKPGAGMAVLGAITAEGDLRHFERMLHVAKPARRPAAILFADLEASSPLSRRLSTASYFALGRRLVRAADRCVIDAGGLVGRHVGDGIVAFFLAESAGSESAAARACITATRALREAVSDVAARSDLQPEDVILRFGLHWGSTLYVGQITTDGRTEVNALGDQVNETARIEACATGGRALASKDLMERLGPEDAVALDLDPDRTTYTPLADLSAATEKARRDAPAIAVCDV
jgi:class 3 adenylate cyclase